MDIFLTILVFLSATICFIFTSLYYLHMYQLNSYKPKEQLTWLGSDFIKRFVLRVIWLVPVFPLAIIFPKLYAFSILFFVLTAFIGRPKTAKKPLVYTNRIKRLIFTMSIIFVAICTLSVLNNSQILLPCVSAIICVLMPWYLLLCDTINKPVEKAINQSFINQAKDIINSSPNLTVIGITGSYGKTSVKYFLNKILSAKYNVLMTPGNYNTTLGVVKTIREHLRATHDIFICEMGARNIGDIKEICDIARPKYGIITSIGEQHMETFKSVENIIKTKFELYDAIPQNGKAFLNFDNKHMRNRGQSDNSIYYSVLDTSTPFYAYDINVSIEGSNFKIHFPDGSFGEFQTKLIGTHNVLNITAAIAIAYTLNVDVQDIATQVKRLESVPHRMELVPRGNNIIIDDAYNSNPSGAKAALDTLATFDGLKFLVTPGMIELGDKHYECNKQLGEYAADKCDFVMLVGKEQTVPIYDGLIENGFNSSNIYIASSLSDAIEQVGKINSENSRKIILLENDLPDNFN